MDKVEDAEFVYYKFSSLPDADHANRNLKNGSQGDDATIKLPLIHLKYNLLHMFAFGTLWAKSTHVVQAKNPPNMSMSATGT